MELPLMIQKCSLFLMHLPLLLKQGLSFLISREDLLVNHQSLAHYCLLHFCIDTSISVIIFLVTKSWLHALIPEVVWVLDNLIFKHLSTCSLYPSAIDYGMSSLVVTHILTEYVIIVLFEAVIIFIIFAILVSCFNLLRD